MFNSNPSEKPGSSSKKVEVKGVEYPFKDVLPSSVSKEDFDEMLRIVDNELSPDNKYHTGDIKRYAQKNEDSNYIQECINKVLSNLDKYKEIVKSGKNASFTPKEELEARARKLGWEPEED